MPGKGAGDENFPVGSLLLSRALRPHVACFYNFARAADDIADDAALTSADRLARLEAFEAALVHGASDIELVAPDRLRDSLRQTGVTNTHARDLLQAFRLDAVKTRYDSWDDLMAYCRLSAAPVGRYLLDLHGENRAHYRYADPLCNVLQVINHLQDCQADYRTMDRVYLPQDWLVAAGITVDALDRPITAPALRHVLDQCLDGCDGLMEMAGQLAGQITSRRLGAESAVIAALARSLLLRLRRHDPLVRRVALSKPRMGLIAGGALLSYLATGRI